MSDVRDFFQQIERRTADTTATWLVELRMDLAKGHRWRMDMDAEDVAAAAIAVLLAGYPRLIGSEAGRRVSRAVLHCLLRGQDSSTDIAAELQVTRRTVERARRNLAAIAVGVVQRLAEAEKLSPAAMFLQRTVGSFVRLQPPNHLLETSTSCRTLARL